MAAVTEKTTIPKREIIKNFVVRGFGSLFPVMRDFTPIL
jgi:hypothetical protein